MQQDMKDIYRNSSQKQTDPYEDPYADLYGMPHHVSDHHPHMSMEERAAQFSPFAALTGYGGEIRETARQTQDRRELTEETHELLDRELKEILARLKQGEKTKVAVTYFVPDVRKEGGAYQKAEGYVKDVDFLYGFLNLTEIGKIPVGDIENLRLIR